MYREYRFEYNVREIRDLVCFRVLGFFEGFGWMISGALVLEMVEVGGGSVKFLLCVLDLVF